MMRAAIFGAGAVGGHLAARLVDAQVGAVQDLARGKGVTTPTMDLLAALLVRRMRAEVQA